MNTLYIGNKHAQELTRRVIDDGLGPVLLQGPGGIGKCSFIKEILLSQEYKVSILNKESKIEEFKEEIRERRYLGKDIKQHKIIIRDADLLSDTCKDFLLLHTESEEYSNILYFTAEDSGLMGDPLLSRMRYVIPWESIRCEDFPDCKDEFYAKISYGSYAIYDTVNKDEKIKELFNILTQEDWPEIAICSKIPIAINEFKNYSTLRKKALSNLFSYSSRYSKYRNSLLKISGLINRYPSINLVNHYVAIASECLSIVH